MALTRDEQDEIAALRAENARLQALVPAPKAGAKVLVSMRIVRAGEKIQPSRFSPVQTPRVVVHAGAEGAKGKDYEFQLTHLDAMLTDEGIAQLRDALTEARA